MDIGVTHIAPEEDHRPVEQPHSILTHGGQITQQAAEHGEILPVGRFELPHLPLILTVMAQTVVALGRRPLSAKPEDRCLKRVEHERDDPRRITLEGEFRHPEHQFELLKKIAVFLDGRRSSLVDHRPRPLLPFTCGLEPLLDLAHRGQILVKASPVSAAHPGGKSFRLVLKRIENAAPRLEALQLRRNLRWITLHEHPAEERAWIVFSRQKHAVACPGEAPVGLFDIDPKIEGWKARQRAYLLRGVLIERDRVAEIGLECPPRRGQKTVVGTVPSRHAGMGEPTNDGEIVPEVTERCQVG